MKPLCSPHHCRFLVAFCVLLVASTLAQAQDNADPKKGCVTTNPSSGYSLEEEVQLGRQAVAEIERKLQLLPAEHPASKYINDLGQRLAEKAPGYKFPYTFKVVREKSINAFAVPGWPIYVHEHAAYRVSYPENWQLNGSPDASVEIAPQGGSANGTLSYGVMSSGFQPKAKGKTLDAAMRELTTEIGLANPGLRLSNSPQASTVHGRAARRMDWTGASAVREKGKALEERVRIVAFPGKSGVILYVLFVAPEPDFEALWSSASSQCCGASTCAKQSRGRQGIAAGLIAAGELLQLATDLA